jgi:hypothetical protein
MFITLREGQRLRVFENRVLRRIFEPKREEQKGDWRKLHSKKSHTLHSAKYNQNDQVKENEMDRACSTNEGEEECI